MTEGVAALRDGRALIDLSSWRKVAVRGEDAPVWLNDLLTAELNGLGAGEARRSLLLSPTGRIRADVTVTYFDDGLLLLQDPEQPSPIDALLAPYVLSSDVALDDRSSVLRLYVLPDESAAPVADAAAFRPSPLGIGRGVILPGEAPLHPAGLVEPTPEDLEAFRIQRGLPRFGRDLLEESLPHEAELGDAIAYGKGCFLGQEAVAKVRNLGHPPFVVLAVRGPDPFAPGDLVLVDGKEVGRVTSATRLESETAALARVRWAARSGDLRTREGNPLRRAGPRSAPA